MQCHTNDTDMIRLKFRIVTAPHQFGPQKKKMPPCVRCHPLAAATRAAAANHHVKEEEEGYRGKRARKVSEPRGRADADGDGPIFGAQNAQADRPSASSLAAARTKHSGLGQGVSTCIWHQGKYIALLTDPTEGIGSNLDSRRTAK